MCKQTPLYVYEQLMCHTGLKKDFITMHFFHLTLVHVHTIDRSVTDLTSTDDVRDRGFANTLPIPSGVLCYNRTTAGSEAVYVCDEGFHQDGATTRVCQSVWNGSIHQCSTDQDGQDGITFWCH